MAHHFRYNASACARSDGLQSLVDRGCNGGLAGEDVRVIEWVPNRFADISGVDYHTINHIPIATVAGVTTTQHGPVVLIMHQYAYVVKGRSIHSCS